MITTKEITAKPVTFTIFKRNGDYFISTQDERREHFLHGIINRDKLDSGEITADTWLTGISLSGSYLDMSTLDRIKQTLNINGFYARFKFIGEYDDNK